MVPLDTRVHSFRDLRSPGSTYPALRNAPQGATLVRIYLGT